MSLTPLTFLRKFENHSPHAPLRSNFELVRNAGAMGDRHPYSRQDVVRKYAARHIREELLERYFIREVHPPTRRIAVAKRNKSGFHVVGIGLVRVKQFKDLKERVKRARRFTHLKFGAILTSI